MVEKPPGCSGGLVKREDAATMKPIETASQTNPQTVPTTDLQRYCNVKQ